LIFDLILDNKGFVTEVNGGSKGCRDGVVSGLALCHETLVTLDDSNGRFFNLPLTDVAEGLFAIGRLLGSLRACPPVRPIISELFNEGSLDLSCLYHVINITATFGKEGYAYRENRLRIISLSQRTSGSDGDDGQRYSSHVGTKDE